MNSISILNPFSSKYHALEDFNKLTCAQKIITVALTIIVSIATAFIAMAAVFRLMVNHYVSMHPQYGIGGKAYHDHMAAVAKKLHSTALSEINGPAKLLNLVQRGLDSGIIPSLDLFNLDQGFKICTSDIHKKGQVAGTCMKAEVSHLGVKQFIYIIDAKVFAGDSTTTLQTAFLSKHDANDIVSLSNLALRHMDSKMRLDLKNKEEGLFVIHDLEDEDSTPFKDTFELPEALLERILPENNVSVLRPIEVEDQGILKEKESEEDLRGVLEELESTYSLYKPSFFTDKTDVGQLVKTHERKTLGLAENQCSLIPYLFHFFNDDKALQDADTIAFRDGILVKAESMEEAKNSYKHIRHIFKETYGIVLAERVFGRHRINKKEIFTLKDLKKALIGTAANVLEADIAALLRHIKKDQPGKLSSFRAGDFLFEADRDLYMQIRKRESFQDLSAEELNFLLGAFRTIPVQNERISIASLDALSESDDYLYRHDLKAVQLMESWKSLNLAHPELALGEFTGKSLVYLELKRGMIFSIPKVEEGSSVLYKVAYSLEDKNDAVISHLLTPINKQQSLYKDDASEHSFLVFRGTQSHKDAKSSGASIYRDFDYGGIGRSSYDAREIEIQQMVEDYLERTASADVTLHISGHSLGGCDTQRALVSLLEKAAEAKEGSPWKKLKNIVVTTFNAPRVNPEVNQRLKEAVRKMKENEIALSVDLNHVRFFDHNYEDMVQKFGDILLGADLQGGTGSEVFKSNPHFKRRIIKMHMEDDAGLTAGTLKRHNYKPFNKSLCQIPYTMETLSCDVEEERKQMEVEMAGNYHWDESEMNLASKIINTIGWHLSWALSQPMKIVQAGGNALHSAAIAINRLWHEKANQEMDYLRETY